MPRKNVMRKWAPGSAASLTFDQILELRIGPDPDRPAFASEDERQAAWEIHGDDILRRATKGVRPWAWWHYSANVERPAPGDESEELESMGELQGEELAAVRRWRAERKRRAE
jgi:hypothetical protein